MKTIHPRCKGTVGYWLSGLFGSLLLAQASLADVAPISTQGNKVLFGGQPGSVSGNSFFWSNDGWGGEKYYTSGTVSWLKTNWKSNLVRAAMGVEDAGGYISSPTTNKNKVKAVVDAAIANDMYVIIDWHSHKAESNQSQAIAFFQDMARTYGNKNHVIYEIYNEPLNVSWSGTIKPYAEAVIAAIRAIDPDNLIVVGTPNWSQDVDIAANDPITGYANIAYTLHFYSGTHGQTLRNKAQTALDRNLPLFVTEWGSVNANGDGGVSTSETNAWVDFMKQKGISNANWSINDKAEGASALFAGASGNGNWTENQLTSSGSLARSIIQGWPALSGGGSSSSSSSSSSAQSSSSSSSSASSISSSSTSSFPCNSGNSINSGGNSINVSQGGCVSYTMKPYGNLQLGSWNAPSGVRYDIRNCNGAIIQNVAQVQNAWVSVATGTNGCTHYIYVKQASNSFTLQFGSW